MWQHTLTQPKLLWSLDTFDEHCYYDNFYNHYFCCERIVWENPALDVPLVCFGDLVTMWHSILKQSGICWYPGRSWICRFRIANCMQKNYFIWAEKFSHYCNAILLLKCLFWLLITFCWGTKKFDQSGLAQKSKKIKNYRSGWIGS